VSYPVWCELVCVGCVKKRLGQWADRTIPRANLKREAHRAGWSLISNEWHCFECSRRKRRQDRRAVAQENGDS
jgi:hypothetical protein